MAVQLESSGPGIEMSAEVDPEGMIYLVVRKDGYRMPYYMPPMSPAEADELAQELQRILRRMSASQ